MISQKQILSKIKELSDFPIVKKNQEILSDLEKLKKRIQDDTFHIAVVGEFSSGKSTFINAILGKDILSHAVNETTATITHICHVDKSDKRLGTCEILYYNGEIVYLKDTGQLKKYTTVQAGENVAEKIRSVTVYVHLPYLSYPITIVDTPGLNGIADKHRKITFEEVKKAHACIYLLSAKGLKESDKEILHSLMKYQSEFIFVQNFIDVLRKTEGETYEAKIEDDRRNLEKICGASYVKKCHICGVSALKALCARDEAIERLFYATDTAVLSQNDRKRLEEESNFQSFENLIKTIVNSGEYKQVIYRSAGTALVEIMNQVLDELENQQAINEELQKSDSQQNRIMLAERKIKQLRSRKEESKKKLSNFIVSYARDCQKNLIEYIKSQLQEIEEKICQEISQKIRNFKQYQEFEKNHGTDVSSYFSRRVNLAVNGEMIPNIQQYIKNDAEDIYNAAMQRVSKYTATLATNISEQFTVQLEEADKKTTFGNKGKLEKINELERQIEREESKISSYRSSAYSDTVQLYDEERNKQHKQIELTTLEDEYRRRITSLGSRPSVEQVRVTETRVRYRRRLFWEIEEPYEVTTYRTDDSAQRRWDAAIANLDAKYLPQIREKKQRISRYEDTISNLEARIARNQEERKRLEEKILHLQKTAEKEKQIYETAEKQFQDEYVKTLKNRLFESLHDSLFDADDCVYFYLKEYIESMYKRNVQYLQKHVERIYVQNIEAQEKQLLEAISQSKEELKQKYHAADKEIKLLKKMQKDISQTFGTKIS